MPSEPPSPHPAPAPQPTTTLRLASPSEAPALTALGIAAKSHWGYSEGFMAAAQSELTITAKDITCRPHIVAEQPDETSSSEGNSVVAGVYSIRSTPGTPARGELSLMWVLPGRMGSGLGRLLWRDALRRAAAMGMEELLVDADPNAEGFYTRMGAVKVGEAESGSIKGRMLPLMRAVVPKLEGGE